LQAALQAALQAVLILDVLTAQAANETPNFTPCSVLLLPWAIGG